MNPVTCARLIVVLVMVSSGVLSAADGQALTTRYCVACHNDTARTANISLQGLDPADVSTHPDIWEKVLRKVATGEMPPEGMPGPEPAVAAKFTANLESSLDAVAAANPNPGRPPPHRLNRAEYSNAVRDLLALDIEVGAMLPADDSGYGFDNIAGVLSLSPVLLERYMATARRIARLATGNPQVKPHKETFDRNKETGFTNAGQRPSSRQDLPFGAERGAAIAYYFPLDGEYEIQVTLGGRIQSEYQYYDLRLPVRAGLRTLGVSFLGESSRAEKARPVGAAGGLQTPLDIRLDGARVKLFDLPAGGPIDIGWISIDGPYNVSGPGDTASRRKIFSCRPSTKAEEAPCARRILSTLARHAYRRPADDSDVGALIAMYQLGRDHGDFDRGIERAIQALLVSPSFLYRIEQDPPRIPPGTPYRLSDVELASRLSFFLWSAPPDEQLLSLAEQSRLHKPEILEAQVRRMLLDPRSKALVENFAGQWLQLRNVDFVKPDEKLFPTFDSELRQAMKRETELFFAKILKNNRSLLELLDANYTFLNERLAEHYGLGKVRGPQFREVPLDDPRRGGLLGHGSILTVTSYPNRTSVVIRGKWVLDNLFGMPPPPPPPDIPELEEAAEEGEAATLRELMARHSANPICSACHVRMDPIGFALENYNAIGQWRDKDGENMIDPSGVLPGGLAFSGPEQLKKVLSNNFRGAFVTTVVEKLLIYALGRGVEYYDKPTVRKLVRDAERAEYRLGDVVVSVAQSMPFQMRRSHQP